MSTLHKPPQWVITKGLIAPEWRWFWQQKELRVYDCSLPTPQLVGPGGRLLTKTGTPDFLTKSAGRLQRFQAGEYWDDDSNPPTSAVPLCMIAVLEDGPLFTSGERSRYLSFGLSASGSHYITLGATFDTGYNYQYRSNGNTTDNTDWSLIIGGTPVAGELKVMVGQALSVSSHELWLDGVLIGTSVATVTPANISPMDFFEIGRLGDLTPGNSTDAGIYWTAVFHGSLTKAQNEQLARDPFGPFRRFDDAALFGVDGLNINSYTGSGGITLSGVAPVEHRKDFSGTGGIAFGGSAISTPEPNWDSDPQAWDDDQTIWNNLSIFSVAGTGGITFSGAAVFEFIYVEKGAGGLTLGGVAPVEHTKAQQPQVAGIIFGGVATTEFVSAGLNINSYTGSGGIVFGGVAPVEHTRVAQAPTGGIVFGGTAPADEGININAFTGTGGMTLGGVAPIEHTRVDTGAGGIIFAGAAAQEHTKVYSGVGGIVFGGSASVSTGATTFTFVGSGGFTLGGAATVSSRVTVWVEEASIIGSWSEETVVSSSWIEEDAA